MRRSAILAAALFGILFLGAIVGVWWTGGSGHHAPPLSAGAIIDGRLLDLARQLAPLATTASEQELAREIARLADHELDQAYATAIREAASAKPPATPEMQQLRDRVARARTRVDATQSRIAKLP